MSIDRQPIKVAYGRTFRQVQIMARCLDEDDQDEAWQGWYFPHTEGNAVFGVDEVIEPPWVVRPTPAAKSRLPQTVSPFWHRFYFLFI